MKLEKRFDELIKRHLSDLNTEFLFNNLKKNYSGRYYHGFNHIQDCLNGFDEVRNLLKKPDEVEMALFYHDVIYDVSNKDNEEKSAEFMKSQLNGLGFNCDFIDGVYSLIMDTCKHKIGKHPDSKYMIDIDFSPLGASLEIFKRDRANVRKEYFKKYDPTQVDFGMLNFYKSILKRDRIFLSDYFFNKYEISARDNIKQGMEELLNLDD